MRYLGLLSLIVLFAFTAGCEEDPADDVDDLQTQIDSLEAANQELRAELEAAREATDPQDVPDETITLDPPIYFPSGSAWLTDRGRATLDSLADVLREEYAGRSFSVRGYTDSRPIGPSLRDVYPSNWYLSAQRAAAVAHYLDEHHGIDTETLEVGAFGPRQPAAAGETPEARQEDRRVEIVVNEDGG